MDDTFLLLGLRGRKIASGWRALHAWRCGITPLALSVVLLGIGLMAACGGPADPEELLREARSSYEIEILSMTRHEGQVLISLRVSDEGSPLELPCLTLDALFLQEGADGPQELARRQLEADIGELPEAGGTLELTWRLDIPEAVSSAWQNAPPEAQTIEIVLHEPSPEGLNALCEAEAIRDQSQ